MVETSTDNASHRVRREFLGWDCESIRGETVESIPTPEASDSERLPTPHSLGAERPEFLPISGW